MKTFSRVILIVIVPVIIGCGIIHLVRNRESITHNSATNTNTKLQKTLTKKPIAEPTHTTKTGIASSPTIAKGLDDYRYVHTTLPRKLNSLAAELGAGILVAPQRKLIIWGKNDSKAVPIASMTKMMTLLIAYDRIKNDPNLSLNTIITVTEAAIKAGGRRVRLVAGHRYTAEKLMSTAIMYSANDASEAIAVGLAPNHDVKKFLAMMNVRARLLGMKRAQYFNVHGMPGIRDNQASPRDMAILAIKLQNYPQILKWAQVCRGKFVHNDGKITKLKSTNIDLLTRCKGVTGLKTGYTNRAGSCVTATCIRNGELLIAVACGFHTKRGGVKGKNKRFTFVSGLFDLGFKLTREMDAKGR